MVYDTQITIVFMGFINQQTSLGGPTLYRIMWLKQSSNWLVVWNIWNMNLEFSPIAWMMIQSDEHIFQGG